MFAVRSASTSLALGSGLRLPDRFFYIGSGALLRDDEPPKVRDKTRVTDGSKSSLCLPLALLGFVHWLPEHPSHQADD